MRILIATTSQFGYLVDYHRYYTYLKQKGYDVKYICWDWSKERLEPNNPDIVYVSREGGVLMRIPRFIKELIAYEKKNNFDKILVNWFKMCSLLLLFIPNKKLYLDIRQVSVHTKKIKRKFFDGMMEFAAKRYKNTSIITDLAAKHINITRYKYLPLGGAYFSTAGMGDPAVEQYKPLFAGNDFIFLYVGTLHKRRMIDCVVGFHEYLKKNPGAEAKFIIVGDAIENDLIVIKQYIADNHLDNYIFPTGYIPQQRLAMFFHHADCGITYFPLTTFNDVQPNTKTYEYLINGIPVIATSTKDNVRLIKDSDVPCGVIIDDNPAEFERGVGEVLKNRALYSKKAIAEKFSEYEWDNLFRKYLDNVLDLPRQKEALAI